MVNKNSREELKSYLIKVPGIGSTLANRVLTSLNPSSLPDLRRQIENDRLQSVNGFGPKRNDTVKQSLERTETPFGTSRSESPSEPLPNSFENGLIEDVRCPVCLTDSPVRKRSHLLCEECGARFPIRRGILDFVGGQKGSVGLAQEVMELPFYARWYEYFRPILTRLITPRSLREEYALSTRLLDLASDSKLLDVGCGTGNFTRNFARHLRARGSGDQTYVTGLDLSWPMLTEAREHSFRDDLEQQIRYVRGDALNLPFRDNRFNRLHSAGALHLMSSIQTVLGEFRRVLEPESKLVIGTFLLGDGTLRPLVKRLGGWFTQIHWFGENELKERLRGQGFIVDEFSVAGDAVTLEAILRA